MKDYERLLRNIARRMQAGDTSQEIQLCQICHFFRADPAYGIGVAKALGIDIDEFIPHGTTEPEAIMTIVLMKTQDRTNLPIYSNRSYPGGKLDGLEK
jgi:Catalase-related immune-responsive